MEFSDFSEEQLENIKKKFAMLAHVGMGIPYERIKGVVLADPGPGMPGRTMVQVKFEPDLTKEEHEVFKNLLNKMSAVLGGRPPIWPAKA